MRQHYEAGVPWEPIVGYSRGVRVGAVIHCSGTAPTGPDGAIVAPGDPGEQTRQCIRNLRTTLEALGGRLEDVVRTRMFVRDATRWEAIGKAHGEFFATIRPVTTLVEVSGFVDPAILVEVEAEAILEG
jgi:enamine deaminase RidA (YjgF/YER057c/UK114 family)